MQCILSPRKRYFGIEEPCSFPNFPITLWFLFIFLKVFSISAFVFVWWNCCEQYFSTNQMQRVSPHCLTFITVSNSVSSVLFPTLAPNEICFCIRKPHAPSTSLLICNPMMAEWFQVISLMPPQSLFGDNPSIMQGFFQVYIYIHTHTYVILSFHDSIT